MPIYTNDADQRLQTETVLHALADFAADLLGVPIALITLTQPNGDVQMWGCGAERLKQTGCKLPFARAENASSPRILIEDIGAANGSLPAPVAAKLGAVRYVASVPIALPDLSFSGCFWMLDSEPHPPGSTAAGVLDHLGKLAAHGVRSWHLEQRQAQNRHVIKESIDALSDSFFVFDLEGRLLRWNAELKNVTGFSDAQITHMHVLDFFAESVQERIAGAIEAVHDHGRAVVEAPLTTRDGTQIPFEFSGSLLHDADGNLLGICGTGRDIRERTRTLEALNASEGRWQALVEQHPAPIMISTTNEIVYANAAVAAIVGADSPEEITGHTLSDFVNGSHHDSLESRLAQLERGEETRPYQYLIQRLDGSSRLVEAFSAPITYHGQPAVQTVLRDVTEEEQHTSELRRAKEVAEEMNRLKSTFLANMSHEIRTPLTSILGFSEVLASKVDGEARDLVRLINEGGLRLKETLNSVLDLAQLEGGAMQIHFQTVDLTKRVKAAHQRFKPQVAQRNLTFVVDLPETPVQARIDTTALDRVLNNLISNALKFTTAGEVRLQVESAPEASFIQVEDTGVGIDPDFLPHLFEEFVQESGGIDREYEGTGLGLTITKRLMDLMQGTIEVDSEKGVGTTFTLRFPHPDVAAAPALQPAPEPDEAASKSASEPLHLLVVEDNSATRRLMHRMLDGDYQVDTAATVDEALAHIHDGAYDAILLDINLSERRTGVEVLHEVRDIRRYDDIPVIACTAYALQGHSQRFLDAGFTSVIAKPFTKRGLLDALTDAFAADPNPSSLPATDEPVENVELPPLPHTLPEIVNLISQDDGAPNTERLTAILRQDSVTSFWLLRHMNSAYYNLRRKISTVERAVTFLGFRPVCNLVLTEILNQHLTDADTPEVQRVHTYLLRTGLSTALYAKKLAARLDLAEPELAYAGGMLSQLGRLLLLSRAPETYAELWAFPAKDDLDKIVPPPLGQEILHCGTDSVTLGARAARAYNFSSALTTVIQSIHRPSPTLAPDLQQLTLTAALSLRAAESLYTQAEWTSFEACRKAIDETALSRLSNLCNFPSEELLFLIYDEKEDVMEFVETITRD